MKKSLSLTCYLSLTLFIQAHASTYLDTHYPDEIPKPFAEFVFSNYQSARCLFVSSDKQEYYFVPNRGSKQIVCIQNTDNPDYFPKTIVNAKATEGFNWCTEPWLSHDGKQLFFAANKDIWVVQKKQGSWDSPTKLGANINSDGFEFHPSVAKNGNLYFHSRVNSDSEVSIYCSKLVDGVYQPRIKIEGLGCEAGDPAIAPDESFLIFSSDKEGGYGGVTDLYISFNNNGEWTIAQNLGPQVNTECVELGPTISADGRYLFFYRRDKWQGATHSKIFWVDIEKVIQENHLKN